MIRNWKKWVPVRRPGYIGANRNKYTAELNEAYGVNMWDYGWRWFGEYMHFSDAFHSLYLRSYTRYLKRNSDAVDEIISYDEVFCYTPLDRDSGMDCMRQQQRVTHLADIAIRIAIRGMNLHFHHAGHNYLHLGGPETNGHKYSPGMVPFFLPDQILPGEGLAPATTMPGTIDHFWQNNKFILVHPDAAPVQTPFTGESP